MKYFKWVLMAVAFATAGVPAWATTGNELLAECSAVLETTDNPNSKGTNDSLLQIGHCLGFTEGVRNTMVLIRISGPSKLGACFPSQGINNGQGARIVVKYLRANPEKLHEDALLLTLLAYKTAFPCPTN